MLSSKENQGHEYNKQHYSSQGLLPWPWEVLEQLHSRSPELHLECILSSQWSWEAIEKTCSWGVPLKTRAYSSQLRIWSKTTPLSKLNVNESQLKAATKYCNHDSSPEVATYLLYFRFEPWWTNLFPHTHRKKLSRSAKVNLMQFNFLLTCALALSYKQQCWGSCNVISLLQGRLHVHTKSWGRQLLPTASIFKLQRTSLVQRT